MINFIVNASSGRGKGQRVLKKIINHCYKFNVEYTVHLTSCKGHAQRISTALCENGASVIVAVGGDGTFHEVLNGLISNETTALGFVPAGRGNDFARGFGIPLDTKKALDRIILGEKKRIDFLEIGGKRCLNASGTGLDIDVLRRVDGKHGKVTYIKSLVYCLSHFEPYRIRVIEGDVEREFECITASVCNSTQYGGGIKVSPLSKVDDGLMDVVIMNMPENRKIFKLLPRFIKGKHLDMPITTHFTCERVKILPLNSSLIQLDGEIYDGMEFDCKVVKGGLITY